jgi:uncharacterized protein YndB with AHSA1/START domain
VKKALIYLAAAVAVIAAAFVAMGMIRSPEFHFTATRDIAKPPETVYDYLTNPENMPKWTPEIQKVEKVGDSPVRYRFTGSGGSTEVLYFDMERPNRFKSRMDMPSMGMKGEWEILIRAEGSGSRITSNANMHIGNPVFRAMASIMDGNAEEGRTLDMLKKHLESN